MAKKRGHGEGSISQRKDGRWMGQITIGIDPTTKKLRRITFYGKTRREVQDKLREAQNQKDRGLLAEPSKTTVQEWMRTWLNDYKKAEVKESTWVSYNSLTEDYINPGLGAIKLSKLRTNDIQRFYNNLLVEGRKRPKETVQEDGSKNKDGSLSNRTVKYIHTVLNGALKQAVKEGLMPSNPAAATTQPRQVKHEITPLSTLQVKKFLKAIEHDWLYPVYKTALGTGLRRGEVLGLKWDVVDLEAGTAHIKRELVQIKGKVKLEEYTKTKGSTRTISLPASLITELKKLKKQQERLTEVATTTTGNVITIVRPEGGPKKQSGANKAKHESEDGFVFCWPGGEYIRPDYVYHRLKKLLDDCGLPSIRFHDLRHTFATMLLEAGVHPKVVSEMLGHSSITITLDTYSHVLPEMQAKAAAKLNGILDSPKRAKHS